MSSGPSGNPTVFAQALHHVVRWMACFALASISNMVLAQSSSVNATEYVSDPTLQDISIALFDPGIPADRSVHRQLGVFPEVRKIEARFLPFVLREILEENDTWGAVRVVPKPTDGDELSVMGRIVRSDGETLEVQLWATDARGQEWVNGTYSMASGTSDPNSNVEISSSFRNVFRQFASELQRARDTQNTAELARNREVALLRYANSLLPSAYADYLDTQPDGALVVRRLPAEQDPTLVRIRRIRAFEHRFIDAIDEQYERLYSQTENSYNLWLRYQERLTRYRINGERRRQNREQSDRPGSYNAMRESYEQYKWLKMEEQNLRNWARGFKNEVDPTVVEVEGQVVELDGSLEQRYQEWRRLLSELFERETSSPVP